MRIIHDEILPTPFSLNWSLGLVDLTGNLRNQGIKVDIGAYESSPEIPIFVNGFDSTSMD